MSIFRKIRQPKVLLVKWGLQGTRLRVIFFIFCIFAAFSLVLLIRTLAPFFLDRDYSDVQYYAKVYCNKPGNVYGLEGQLKAVKGGKRNYKLQQIHIVIRHGDRAPIVLDTLPNSKPVEISCTFNKSWSFANDLLEIRKGADVFEVAGAKKYPILQEREVCIGAQLTPVGFSQHLNNGKFLRRYYDDFIESIEHSSQVKVKSTAYSRTVQSAASLLYGLFGRRFAREKLVIDVESDKYRETHFLQHVNGEHIYCPVLAQKLREVWGDERVRYLKRTYIENIQKEFAKIFDSDVGKIASLDRLIDILYANLCHDRDLPKGPNGLVSYNLASSSFGIANQLITVKHDRIAQLQTLAIISQVIAEVAKLIDDNYAQTSSKLVLFSGHDTVISPLLSTLGIHDWRWPPYASRLVFELWNDRDGIQYSAAESKLFSKFDNYFIRVLYNGEDLTSKVKFCEGQIVENQLCPVAAFVKFVSDDRFDGSNYFERIRNLCVGTDTD